MSQEPAVHYHVRVDPERHELVVKAHYRGDFASGERMLVETPSWVPGNYNFMQFARDIFELEAVDPRTGAALELRRAGWEGFEILAPKGEVELSYRAYAFEPEFGEPSGILDSSYAVLLGTRYLYCKDHLGPCRVSYELPKGWEGRIHHPSGAEQVPGQVNTWDYPSYEILLDTPVVMGNFDVHEREVAGTPIYFVFVDRGVGFQAEVEGFADELARVAAFFHEMYGSFPFSDYSFVMSLNPQNEWGLEHLTSTMCGLGPDVFTDEDQYKIGVRVCAHEMFHAWNVRRLRPAPLLQLQHHLDSGSFSEGLWVAEGFTRYYEFLSCTVTGVYSPEEFFSNIVGYYEHLTIVPAYERVTAVDSSLATYLNHNPKYPGRVNNCIDYYDKGMLIAFGLDASLRLAGQAGGLNQAFRGFYDQYLDWPVGDSTNPGYSTEDVIRYFNELQPGLGERLEREVLRPGGLDTEAMLQSLGFEVVRESIHYLGLVFTDDSATIYNLLDDSPAGQSGLAPGDVLTAIDGFSLTKAGLQWAATHAEPVTLGVLRGHRALEFRVVPGQREAIRELIWRGDDEQRRRLYEWFGREFELEDGQVFSLEFYENFHGIETTY